MSEVKEESKPAENKNPSYPEERHIPNAWLLRPCEDYQDEYSECNSIKARFHQYFIHGESIDCTQWQTDYMNCQRFRLQKDTAALEAVIKSENVRRFNRLAPHIQNNVWKHRDSPPADWNKPLPANLQESYKGTYLDYKAAEFKAQQT